MDGSWRGRSVVFEEQFWGTTAVETSERMRFAPVAGREWRRDRG